MTSTLASSSTLAEPAVDTAFARRSADYLRKSGLSAEQTAEILENELGIDSQTALDVSQ